MLQRAALALAATVLMFAFDPVAARGATPTACELFPAQAATALAGEAVGAPKDVQGKNCTYTTKSSALVGFGFQDMSDDDAKSYMTAMQTMLKAPATAETIPNLGEQNFLIVRPDSQNDKNALMVHYHGKALTLGVQRKMTPELKAQMVKMMRQLMTKF